jgi:hypothetical protein
VGGYGLGARFPSLIEEAEADARMQYGVPADQLPSNWTVHRDAQRRKGHALLGAGIALAIVGVGLLSYGAYRLARSRRRHSARIRWRGQEIVFALPAL